MSDLGLGLLVGLERWKFWEWQIPSWKQRANVRQRETKMGGLHQCKAMEGHPEGKRRKERWRNSHDNGLII